MIMSALAQVDMSSSLRDCWLSQGGSDGQRGQGHHACEGTQAGACDSPDDGEGADAGEGGHPAGATPRHIRRLIERVEQASDHGLAHRGRGKPSNRRIPETVKTKGLQLYAQRYGDFGPTLAAEKLAEYHGITISAETMRVGCGTQASTTSRGGSARTGRGGSGRRMWGSWGRWMVRTRTGSRGAGLAAC